MRCRVQGQLAIPRAAFEYLQGLAYKNQKRNFIWFSDKKTEEYFKEICIDKPDLQTNPPVGLLPDRGITA